MGKTSLLARFIHDTFNAEQNATVQATFVAKKVQIDGDEVMQILCFWGLKWQGRKWANSPHRSTEFYTLNTGPTATRTWMHHNFIAICALDAGGRFLLSVICQGICKVYKGLNAAPWVQVLLLDLAEDHLA